MQIKKSGEGLTLMCTLLNIKEKFSSIQSVQMVQRRHVQAMAHKVIH